MTSRWKSSSIVNVLLANQSVFVVQPGTLPGQCWAFKGARGFLVVQLSGTVKVEAVSVEHMPRTLSRTDRIDSAPRRMTLLVRTLMGFIAQ